MACLPALQSSSPLEIAHGEFAETLESREDHTRVDGIRHLFWLSLRQAKLHIPGRQRFRTALNTQ